ncbi:MAG: ribosome biogenesis GTPase Der [Pseudomonadota bacterium]
MKPIVAIVGRPNVGKSRLFNRLIGYRKAIVDDRPGVTRDRHYAVAEWAGREFIVVDTGGIDFAPEANIESKVTKQSLEAISQADVVLCLFDGRAEPTSHDRELARKLNETGKPIVFALNKIDTAGNEDQIYTYYELGLSSVVHCSAEHGRNVDAILEEVVKHFPPVQEDIEKAKGLRVTVLGRPNVGKSTLINRLAGSERVVAHELAGTTRDAIDVDIEFDSQHYVFIDTAGLRKSFRVDEKVEKVSAMKSLRTIDRSDVVCFLLDAQEGITHQDLSLAGFVNNEGKGLVLLVNKWDLVDTPWDEYVEGVQNRLKELFHVPILAISAKTGANCLRIFNRIQHVHQMLNTKISTAELNKFVKRAVEGHHLPVCKGKQINIYYATQTGTRPPTFTLFSNYPAAVPYIYRRYLMNRLAEEFNLQEVPVRLIFRKK